MQSIDLPTMLANMQDRPVTLADPCPKCEQQTLKGMYEHDTNGIGAEWCTNPDCDYKESGL